MTITISIALPGLLGLNGSLGNAEVLATRLRRWEIETSLSEMHPGESLTTRPDIVVIGQGTSSMATPVARALSTWKDTLVAWHEAGTHFLGVGLGGDLLGVSVALHAEAEPMPGVALSNVSSTLQGPRTSAEVSGIDYQGRESAGYLNDATIRVAGSLRPLFSYLPVATEEWRGNTTDTGEGVAENRLWVSAMSGPLLALNPAIADDILLSVLAQQGRELPAPTAWHQMVDRSAETARSWIRARLGAR